MFDVGDLPVAYRLSAIEYKGQSDQVACETVGTPFTF